ncbi:unnamed protein product, partial [Rotaria sp. Silwood1]
MDKFSSLRDNSSIFLFQQDNVQVRIAKV